MELTAITVAMFSIEDHGPAHEASKSTHKVG